jgi:hypothetical protein
MLDILPAQPLDAEQMPMPERIFLHEPRTIGNPPRGGKRGHPRVHAASAEID